MLRICFYLAMIAILLAVRSSEAANCTSTTFTQQLDAAKLAASKIITAEYANTTKAQIIQQLIQQFNDTVVSFNYTVTQNGDTISIDYNIVSACNDTTTTVSSDGTQSTQAVTSNVNKTQMQKSVSAGLTDRCNQVSIQAQQVQSGASDTTCNVNVGGDNYIEWAIQTSNSSYSSALSAGSFKNANDFHNSLVNAFRANLTAIYSNQIANVTFVSQTTAANGGYILTFRVYFTITITDSTQRTNIVSNIQAAYYQVLTKYFTSVSKTMNIPSSVSISAPTAVSAVSKTAIVASASKDSSKSVVSGSALNSTKVSSSSSVKTSSSSNTKTSGQGTESSNKNTTTTDSKSGSVSSSDSKSKGSSLNITLTGGSSGSKTSVSTGAVGGSLNVNVLGDKSKNSSASGSTNITVDIIGGEPKEISTTVKKTGASNGSLTLNVNGSSGNKNVSTSKATGKSSGSVEVSSSNSKTGSSIKSSNGTKTISGGSGASETVSKQKSQTANGSVSIEVGLGNGKSGSSSSKQSSGAKTVSGSSAKSGAKTANASSAKSGAKTVSGSSSKSGAKTVSGSSGKSGTKTVTSTKQESETVDGSVSIQLNLGNGASGSTGSKQSSGAKTANASSSKSGAKTVNASSAKSGAKTVSGSSGKSGTKTVTSTKQKSETVDGSVSIQLNLGNGASGSTDSKQSSGAKTVNASSAKSGAKTVSGSSAKSGAKTVNVSSSKSGVKTVTSTKQESETVGGSVSIKLNSGTGISGSKDSDKSSVNKTVNADTSKSETKPAQKDTQTSGSVNDKSPKTSNNSQTSGSPQTGAAPKTKESSSSKNVSSAPKAGSGSQGAQSKASGTPKNSNVVVNTRKQSSTKSRKGSSSTKSQSSATVATGKNSQVVSTVNKGTNGKNKITLQSLVRTSGQSQGKKVRKLPRIGNSIFLDQSYGVTDQESNAVRDITIDTIPYEYQDTSIDSASLNGLLAYLLYGRGLPQVASSKSQSSGCALQDTYVNYIYEYDILNQVFNSSLQDPNSDVIQGLQSDIADWTAEEIYKRNLVAYVTDDARLTKIIDVSNQYNNRAALRFYISINVSKNLIPVIRRILETVGEKLQTQRFSTSNKNIDWGNMVLIPIQK